MIIKKEKTETRYYKKDYHEALVEKYGEEYHKYRQMWDYPVLKFPINIDIEINDTCNFRCLMCIRGIKPGINTGVKLSFDLFKKIIDEGIKNGVRAIAFGSGDEPLLHPQLIDMVKYANINGIMDIRLHTNGLLLTKKISESFIKNGLTWLSVSLDATDEHVFKKIRRNKHYNKIIQNINDFLIVRKKYHSKLPILRLSYVVIKGINDDKKQFFMDQWYDKADYIAFQSHLNLLEEKKRQIQNFFCLEPFRKLWIRANGDVYMCCTQILMFSQSNEIYIMGNIKNSTITEIWNSNSFNKIRKKFFNLKPPDICIECQQKRI